MHVSVVNQFYVQRNTFGRLRVFFCCFFFSARRKKEGRRAGAREREAFKGEGKAGPLTVVVSVSRLAELRRRDGRDALVWLGRGHKARQAGALVGALGVGAPSVLAQRHLVADVLALVDVCGKTTDDKVKVPRLPSSRI